MRLIDAIALKEHICNMCDDGERECKGDESCAILCWVNDMPTISPEVQHGRWIPIDGEPYAKCSYCGEKHYGCTTPYCDMCGAYMREVKEDAGTD